MVGIGERGQNYELGRFGALGFGQTLTMGDIEEW